MTFPSRMFKKKKENSVKDNIIVLGQCWKENYFSPPSWFFGWPDNQIDIKQINTRKTNLI